MKMESNIKYWLLICLISGLSSCTKQEIGPQKSGTTPPAIPNSPEGSLPGQEFKELMPVRISRNKLSMQLTYTSTQQLKSIVSSTDSTVINYNSKSIARDISVYQQGKLVGQTNIYRNEAGLPEVLEKYKVENKASVLESAWSIVYDAKERIRTLIKTSPQKIKIDEIHFSYLENGSLEVNHTTNKQLYLFSLTKGKPLLKHAKNAWVFALEGFPPFFYTEELNLVQGTGTAIFQLEYLYNAAGFPQQIEWKTGTQKELWSIIYQEIPAPKN